MKRRHFLISILSLEISLTAAALSSAELCPKWATAVKQGELDTKIVGESSGLAISRKFDVIYHTNDSGTGPEFQVSKMNGGDLKTVRVDGYRPVDPEDLALGPCAVKTSATCLLIADIGDNWSRRKTTTLIFVEEKNPFPARVAADFIATLKYPDGAHNAESVALLDNGDVIILTKELSIAGLASPARVYRTKREDYLKSTEAAPALLEKIGEIDLPTLLSAKGYGGIATGMAANANGSRFTVLTYSGALEFSVDLKAPKLPKVQPSMVRAIPLYVLIQQEAIAYDKNERDLFYSHESLPRKFGLGGPAQIYKVACETNVQPASSAK